ncbi:hypothetical protein PG984_000201 [Apiospora sp. TS-2023a]
MAADQRTSNPGLDKLGEDDEADFRHWDEYVMSFDERKAKILEMLQKEYPDGEHAETYVGLPRVRHCNSSLEYPVTFYNTSQGSFREAVMIPEDPAQATVDDEVLEYIWYFAPEAVKKLAPRSIYTSGVFGAGNPLNRPWILLGGPAICGLPLSRVWDRLSRKQKVAVASQLGLVYREVQTMREVGCGYPEIRISNEIGDDEDDYDNVVRPGIRCYHMTAGEGDEMAKALPNMEEEEEEEEAASETYLASAGDVVLTRHRLKNGPGFFLKARQILVLQLQRWIHILHHRYPVDLDDDEANDQCGLLQCALYMAREIIARNPDVFEPKDEDGNEDDHPNMCLHNPYLGTPENIMVEFRAGSAEPTITGIWDWGASAFDPRFASCRPPSWLWSGGVSAKEEAKAAKVEEEKKKAYGSVATSAAPATTGNGVVDDDDDDELATVRIRGLWAGRSWSAQEAELRAAFAKFGRITSLVVPYDRRTARTRLGWATITYADADDAAEACRQMNGQPLPAPLDEQQQQKQPQEDKDEEENKDDDDDTPKMCVVIDTVPYNDSIWKPRLDSLEACDDRLAVTVQQAHAERDSLWYDRRGDEPLDPTAIRPTDAAGEEIQRAFDEAVGAPFRRVAYNPDMAFARNLYAVVRDRPWRRSVVGHNLKVLEGLVTAWYEKEAERAANFDDDDE